MSSNNSPNDTHIIIDEISSGFAVFGAIVCVILGTCSNGLALSTLLTRPKVRKQGLSPLVFYLSLCYLLFCTLLLPLVIMRFIYREDIIEHLGKFIF